MRKLEQGGENDTTYRFLAKSHTSPTWKCSAVTSFLLDQYPRTNQQHYRSTFTRKYATKWLTTTFRRAINKALASNARTPNHKLKIVLHKIVLDILTSIKQNFGGKKEYNI